VIISANLLIIPPPTAGIAGTTIICGGSSTVLTATGGSSYLWNTGDTTVSISVNPLTSTAYSVIVSNPGCVLSDSASVMITVNPLPVINAIPDSTTIIQGESITLSVSGGIAYSWTPAAGLDNPANFNPIATPTETTLYYVSGTDANGCSNIDSVLVVVSEEFAVGVPNIFSPNGDGENDILYVESKGIKWLRFIIYDRWGEKVFESNDVNTGWDGLFRGKPMNPTVFVYYIEVSFTNDTEITRQGNVALVR